MSEQPPATTHRTRDSAILLAIAVPYTRNVDFSLFKRRLFYKLISPLARALNWCPVFFLYCVPVVWWFVGINVFAPFGHPAQG